MMDKMKMVEAVGKNLDEAIASGLKRLRVNQAEVNYEVLSQSNEETKVKLMIKEPRQYLYELTNLLLRKCGFQASISVTRENHLFYINIKTRPSDSILIGRRGETLWSLEHLLLRLAKRFYSNIKILVDVNGYRAKQNNFLKKKTEAIARIVLQTGREMALDPLTRREERIVIGKISEIKGVKLYTLGKGPHRTLIIAPNDESR